MKYYAFIIGFITITACSSVKQQKIENPLTDKSELRNLSIDGNISTTFPDLQQSLSFSLKAAKKDSVKVEIYGPLSIVVGKLFATSDKFLFYNSISSEAYTGTPSAKNLKYALNLPLSYSDFISFLRCEPAHNVETYLQDMGYNSADKLLFKSEQKGYIDYILLDAKSLLIAQQQRKMMDGKVILNVLYDDYEPHGEFVLPYEITFNFPLQDGSIYIKAANIEVNRKYEKPFNFSVPSSVKMNQFD